MSSSKRTSGATALPLLDATVRIPIVSPQLVLTAKRLNFDSNNSTPNPKISKIEYDPNNNENDCPDLNYIDLNKNFSSAKEANKIIESQAIALLDLPTDCLINIFKYLPVIDLVYLCEVNRKFREIIAKHVIGQKYFQFNEINQFYSTRKAFKLFGNYFRRILVRPTDIQYRDRHLNLSNEILRLIAKYCSPNKLKEISLLLSIKTIDDQIMNGALPIFQNIETLTLQNDGEEDRNFSFGNFLLSFSNIMSIKLIGYTITQPLPSLRSFPNMQSINFNHCGISLSVLFTLLSGENNIQSFKWIHSCLCCYYQYHGNASQLSQLIADNLPNIEELCLVWECRCCLLNYQQEPETISQIYQPIGQLTKLKIVELQSFSLNCVDIHNILKDFARKNTIQKLSIHVPSIQKMYNNNSTNAMDYNIFANFTSLRSLFIYSLSKHSHNFCIEFLLKLPCLSELCIQNSNALKQQTILKIVECQRDLMCLKLLGQVKNFSKQLYCSLIYIKSEILHSETKLEIYLKRTQRDLCISKLGESLYNENLISLMPLDI